MVTPCNGENGDQKGLVSPYNGVASDHEVLVALWAQITCDHNFPSEENNIFEAYLSDLGLKTFKQPRKILTDR